MPEITIPDHARYALDIVRRICAQVGPGLPGTPQERARAQILKEEFEAHLGAENVVVEEFSLAPDAFLGALPLSAVFTLAAALLNLSVGRITGIAPWLSAAAALACALAALSILVVEFLCYAEWIDPLFPKKTSVNLIASLRRPGAGDVKRLLLLSGHHDSALENTWFRFLGYGFYVTLPTILLGVILILGMSALQLLGVLASNADLVRTATLGWVLLAYPLAPAIIFAVFFNMGRKNGGTVPGAADNLAASALTAALCRILVENPDLIPPDTEIRFVSFGSEEAGLRGSQRYVARHLEELKRLDARLLNFEVIAHPEIIILTNDVAGVKNAPEMVSGLAAAAERAGVPYKVQPYPAGGGGSDAGPFSQAGLKAATLLPFKVPQQLVAFYHQKWDGPEVLTLPPLENVLKLALEWLRRGGVKPKQHPRLPDQSDSPLEYLASMSSAAW